MQYLKKTKITFVPFEVVGRCPECLKRFQPGDIWCIDFDPAALNDMVIKACINMPSVKKLSFSKCKVIPNYTVLSLRSFHNLTDFDATDSGFDGAMLAQAGCWDKLVDLNVSGVKNLGPLFRALKGSAKLRKISIMKNKLSSEDFRSLAELTQLTKLDLYNTHVTEQDLIALGALKDLNALHIGDSGLSMKALAQLKNFKRLTYLDLTDTRLTNANLKYILSLGNFEELKLEETGLDITATEILKDYKPLKRLQIQSKGMDNQHFEQFKDALPGIRVW
jgi:Leucine-rich repeat (LRR) protein